MVASAKGETVKVAGFGAYFEDRASRLCSCIVSMGKERDQG